MGYQTPAANESRSDQQYTGKHYIITVLDLNIELWLGRGTAKIYNCRSVTKIAPSLPLGSLTRFAKNQGPSIIGMKMKLSIGKVSQ